MISKEKRKQLNKVFYGQHPASTVTVGDVLKIIDSLFAPDSPPAEPVKGKTRGEIAAEKAVMEYNYSGTMVSIHHGDNGQVVGVDDFTNAIPNIRRVIASLIDSELDATKQPPAPIEQKSEPVKTEGEKIMQDWYTTNFDTREDAQLDMRNRIDAALAAKVEGFRAQCINVLIHSEDRLYNNCHRSPEHYEEDDVTKCFAEAREEIRSLKR